MAAGRSCLRSFTACSFMVRAPAKLHDQPAKETTRKWARVPSKTIMTSPL